ncbi:MAG TPA: HAD-IIIA family hydrolase [Chitinophagaceae bacterium]|nr:HAD-IIIA family hydrolase [Chitinophagaceae bacterium]
MNVLEKFFPVNTIILDMDGVLTDGSLLITPDGEWIRKMNIKDGYILQLAVKKGYRVIVITGSFSTPVEKRLNKLGVAMVYQNVKDKMMLLKTLMAEHGFNANETLYMGDDIPDLEVMKYCGLSCCPADSSRDILAMADYISPVKGGEGCVREVIEKLMRVQSKWEHSVDVSST